MSQPDRHTRANQSETNIKATPAPSLGPLMVIRIFIPLLLISTTTLIFVSGLMIGSLAIKVEDEAKKLAEKAALIREKGAPVRLRHAVHAVLTKRALYLPVSQKNKVADIVIRYSGEHGHDPFLLLAVIETESSYRPKVVSRKGAVGLMQIRPFVGLGLSGELDRTVINKSALYDPEVNVRLGAYYLAKLLRKFDGNLEMALEAYNRGPYRLKRNLRKNGGGKIAMPYTKKVLKAHEDIRKSLEGFGLAIL